MEAERSAELRRVLPKLALGLVVIESFTLNIFRSGGRTELSFWQWVKNHTIFGPPVEYVPEEDYRRELQGIFPGYPIQEHAQTFTSKEEAMAYFQCAEASIKELVKNEAISIVVGSGKFQRYADLLADVRYDHDYHSIRSLVQPDNPEVRDIARVLIQAPDFISASQELVNSFTTYRAEVGDYWAEPWETLAERAGDCDDLSILLCSILRNYIPADEVYCAFGLWTQGGKRTGHMWNIVQDENGEDRILEATAHPAKVTKGKYVIHSFFNDQYCFATDIGIREFDLKPIELAEVRATR